VGSPRLFSLFVADRFGASRIRILNPDARDAVETREATRLLGAERVGVDVQTIESLHGQGARYDAVWSISVIEHIPENGDTEAMRVMYQSLAPGGRLLVTVPVDRSPSIEHRPIDTYQLGLQVGPEGYFFQRWYDLATLRQRLLSDIDLSLVTFEWFGEATAGQFSRYVQRWLRLGPSATLGDPLEIGRHYRQFSTWAEMPGQGVCGIAIRKPAGNQGA
jgi:SAM-dependent methyltransferase